MQPSSVKQAQGVVWMMPESLAETVGVAHGLSFVVLYVLEVLKRVGSLSWSESPSPSLD